MGVCSTMVQWVYPYLDGELDLKEARRVDAHLAQCRACGDTVALERQFLDAVRSHGTPQPVPASLQSRVVAAISPDGQQNGQGQERRELRSLNNVSKTFRDFG